MHINPSKGSKIGKKRGKKVHSGTHALVLKLVKDLGIFEWTGNAEEDQQDLAVKHSKLAMNTYLI